MEIIRTILVTLFALGILIAIHEFGHFWVARRCGVKVLRFSLGFGKPLFKWTDKLDTEFVISALPLGGYVKMLDERDGNVSDADKHLSFNSQPVWQRMAIVAAGPLANFLLAIVVFYVLFLGGSVNYRAVIDEVAANTPAALAGMQPNEELVAVNGQAITSQQDAIQALLDYYGEEDKPLALSTRRFDALSTKDVLTESKDYQLRVSWPESGTEGIAENPLEIIGLKLFIPNIIATISRVMAGSPAEKAGLQVGDQLLSVNSQAVSSWAQWVEIVKAHPEKAIQIGVERDSKPLQLQLVPEAINNNGVVTGRAGVAPTLAPWPESMKVETHYSFVEAWQPAVEQTWNMTAMTLSFLKKMVTGKLSFKQVGGPITIAKQAGESSRLGWQPYLGLIALLSISLAVLNLLPIPVLDGGMLVFLGLEAILRRPVPEALQMAAYQIGAVLVFGFMLFAIFNDLLRL